VFTFAVTMILALGSSLHVAGHRLIPLPWGLFGGLPLFRSLVPSRLALFAELILAICVAMWLAQRSRNGIWRWLIVFAGVAALVPNVADGWWSSRPDNPAFFATSQYTHYLARGEDVLTIPFGYLGTSMLWQSETDFYFAMPGGYISGVIPTPARHNLAVRAFFGGSTPTAHIPAKYTPAIRAFLRQHHIRHVVIERGYQDPWTPLLRRIAPSPRHIGGILLYTVN
jgi:hypothetical protein